MASSSSIVFSTGGSEADSIVIEADRERNVDASGNEKTRFAYNDKAYFRVYAPDLSKLKANATAGTLTDHGTYTGARDAEQAQFIDNQEYSFGVPVSSVASFKYFGKSLGAVTKSGTSTVKTEQKPNPATGAIALCEIVINSPYRLYSIQLPTQTESEFPVLIDVRT
jgi:hypothetical protein